MSTFHADFYTRPGPAVAEEVQYKSPTAEHYTYALFTRARDIDRGAGYRRQPGYDNRWRFWQIWNRKLPSGHFKTFVNDASDSFVESDYRLNLGETRLRDREIDVELALQKPSYTLKFNTEHVSTLNLRGNNYELERRLFPSITWLTYPLPLVKSRHPSVGRGWQVYGHAAAQSAYGRDAVNRPDGMLASGRMGGIFTMPVAGRLTSTIELTAENDFHKKELRTESTFNTPKTKTRLTLHQPWLNASLQAEVGYAREKLWENKSLAPPKGEIEHEIFTTLRSNLPHWKSSLATGLDLREGKSGLSDFLLQTRYSAGWINELASFVRYDPEAHRLQSLFSTASATFRPGFSAGLGFQTVHTDSEIQIQFTPSATFETLDKKYRASLAGFYDAKRHQLRTLSLSLSKAFRCVETSLKVSKSDKDFQINVGFQLSGYRASPDILRNADVNPSTGGAGSLPP